VCVVHTLQFDNEPLQTEDKLDAGCCASLQPGL